MANDAKRVSQLGITTSVSANDRVVVVTNPGTAYANTQTITLTNFISTFASNALPVANTTTRGVVSLNGNSIQSNTAGGISINLSHTYVWSNTHTFLNLINGVANNSLYLNGIDGTLFVTTNGSASFSNTQTFLAPTNHYGNVLIQGAIFSVNTSSGTAFINSTSISLTNSSSSFTFFANNNTVTIGNSTVYSTVNSTTVSTNTINLGTYTNGANGYTYLPNGFKLNWGWVSANSTAGNVTFSSAYTTNVYSVTASSNTTVATYQSAVVSQNNTVAVIRTGNATSTNVFWHAIGF